MVDNAAIATTEAPDTVSILTGGRRTTLIWEERRGKDKAPENVQETVRKALAHEKGEPEKPVEKPHGPHVKHAVRAAFALANAPPTPKLEPKAPEIIVQAEPVHAPVEVEKVIKAKPPRQRPITGVEFPAAPPPGSSSPLPALIEQPVAQKPAGPAKPTAKAFADLEALLEERRAEQEDEEKWVMHFITHVLNGELV